MSGAPILLVIDDDEDIREILTLVLEDEGYRVVSAPHGDAALTMLHEGLTPQLILLDLMMPVMDGWRFWDVRQTDARLGAIPLIVLTATGLRTGALGDALILPKPVEREVLLKAIQDARRAPPAH